MPSASFSVAMASSFIIHRNAGSSNVIFSSVHFSAAVSALSLTSIGSLLNAKHEVPLQPMAIHHTTCAHATHLHSAS